MAEKKKQAASTEKKPEPMIAKKDITICHNDYLRKIQAGEDISDVPPIFHENLRTEGVL
jgi:hypothetical protein